MVAVREMNPLNQLNLPPGFRFFPSDEELMVQYLCKKVAGYPFPILVIGEIDLYQFDPWVLPNKALFGDKEWYFFTPRDRKYPNGSRPNRVAGSGYWKATGTDKVIKNEGRVVGIKKALVFYIGKAPKGTKTNWIMHEYRLSSSTTKPGGSRLDDWVLCRIYKKNAVSTEKTAEMAMSGERSFGALLMTSSARFDDVNGFVPEMENGLFGPSGVSNNQQQQMQWNQMRAGHCFGSGQWSAVNGPIGLGQAQFQGQFMGGHVTSGGSGTCGLRNVDSPQEVQSGVNPVGDFAGQGFSDRVDLFGIRFPAFGV